MPELSDRQAQLLQIIIEEYVKTAEPVGSDTIVKKYDLGVSPATIRNEMVRLANEGYLDKSYSSSGRVPTSVGFRYYIQMLMLEKKLSVSSEVALRQRLYDKRFKEEDLMRDAVSALANETNSMALGTMEQGSLYYSGMANILESPEFFDIDLTKTVLGLLDQHDFVWEMLSKVVTDESVSVLIGDESGMQILRPCSIVFTRCKIGERQGYLGVFGPARMAYPRVVPTVRYVGSLIEEFLNNW